MKRKEQRLFVPAMMVLMAATTAGTKHERRYVTELVNVA